MQNNAFHNKGKRPKKIVTIQCIVGRIANRYNTLPKNKLLMIVKDALNEVSKALANDERVNIHSFGVFESKVRDVFSHSKGGNVKVRWIRFKAMPTLKKRVNHEPDIDS